MDGKTTIKFHFLGKAYIEKNAERLVLPFKKAELLLFYLAIEGAVPREKIKTLLWGDKGDKEAAGNLRNTICLLKKNLPQHFCSYCGDLSLNGFTTDINELILKASDTLSPSIFEEPLTGIDMPSSIEFSEWLFFARKQIRDKTIRQLRKLANDICVINTKNDSIGILSAIVRLDPFDEDTLLKLMSCHSTQGLHLKALSIYRDFCEKLQNEGAAPSAETRLAAQKILINTEDTRRTSETFFFGRDEEIKRISDQVAVNSGGVIFCCVHGEAGIGKTAFVDRAAALLAEDNSEKFTASPLPVGEQFSYSSWNAFVRQIAKRYNERGLSIEPEHLAILSRYFYDLPLNMHFRGAPFPPDQETYVLGDTLATLVNRLCAGKRPILIFEDIHWYDDRSLALLRIFITELRVSAVFFITSRPEKTRAIIKFLYNIKPRGRYSLLDIPLLPFTQEETSGFCRCFLSEKIMFERGEDYFQNKSAGIPLLLTEMMKVVRTNCHADCSGILDNLIMSRFEDLTKLQYDLLSLLSVFGAPTSVDDIAMLLSLAPEEIYEPLAELLHREMIREVERAGGFYVDFYHSNVRECVYNSIPGFKRVFFHKRAAGLLSSRSQPQIWKPELSAAVCHHYKMAGEEINLLGQHLEEMVFDLNLNHVLFPLIEDKALLRCAMPFSNKFDTEKKFKTIAHILERCDEIPVKDKKLLRRLNASYHAMYGCYLISWGEYENGMAATDLALKMAEAEGFSAIALRCLENRAYHYLQTDNSGKLSEIGNKILNYAKDLHKEAHIGLALRFIGLAHTIELDYKTAKNVFQASAKMFEELESNNKFYTISRLAPLCYIGEICQWEGDSESAKNKFEYCMALCRARGLLWGQSHFHSHAADVALGIGDWETFGLYIKESTRIFEYSRGGCCTSTLYSLKAISDARDGILVNAVKSLKNAEFLIPEGKKSWRAACEMSKAWALKFSESERENELSHYLKNPREHYAETAAKLYEELGYNERAAFITEELVNK